ncbi:porin [Leucothrix sargassi]|nr:porin [Leucothrix sargassi]
MNFYLHCRGIQMKLKTLAIAVAMASVPFAAQADLDIGGDVTVGYFGNSVGDNELLSIGSELTLSADEKVGQITYFGSVTANFDDALLGGGIGTDDLYVGLRGNFGEVRLGDTDNGCDAVDTGWVADDEFLSHNSGGCAGSDQNNITYKRSMGPATVAVSHSPNGSEYNAIGVSGSFGPVSASLGYEAGDELGDSDKNVVIGLSGKVGMFDLGVRASRADDEETLVGYTAKYTAGPNKMYVGFGENDSTFLGYQRALSGKTTMIVEYADQDGYDEAEYAVALKHDF